MNDKPMERIIQESVPGKQVTIAHVIASPMADIYERLGIDEQGALGILTLTPCETAIIAADIATKAAEVEIGFLDRFTARSSSAAMCSVCRQPSRLSRKRCSRCSDLTPWL